MIDREHTPVGTIDAVIRPPSGVRLIVAVAGYRDRFVVVPGSQLTGTVDPAFGGATRLVASSWRADILGGPTYRREMGRLVPERTCVDPFPFPPATGWEAADDHSRSAVRSGLAAMRLTTGEPVMVDAWHGVIHLHGRIATDAGLIEAMRVAYGAVGVWHVISTAISDEALGMQLRRHVRGSTAAGSVAAIAVRHGAGVVTPFHGAILDSATLASWHEGTLGLASLTVGPPQPR